MQQNGDTGSCADGGVRGKDAVFFMEGIEAINFKENQVRVAIYNKYWHRTRSLEWENEATKFWLLVLNELKKNRSVKYMNHIR
ncbi:hypothetical protein EDM54_13845 [Brevibacillus borstelensis]|nr:hypothetical protein EDM54_13845 [Brevibacillus borstelensis]GED54939.1 hypothetical protein BBO01nite_41800 [Brevibacillus borstelensis]